MPDILTADERALIGAFPEARVQRVPRGVTGDATYIYDPLATVAGNLVASKATDLREQIKHEANAAKRAKYHAKRKAAMWQRRRLVLEMHESGRDVDQIAAHVGVCAETVKGDIKAIRERGQ